MPRLPSSSASAVVTTTKRLQAKASSSASSTSTTSSSATVGRRVTRSSAAAAGKAAAATGSDGESNSPRTEVVTTTTVAAKTAGKTTTRTTVSVSASSSSSGSGSNGLAVVETFILAVKGSFEGAKNPKEAVGMAKYMRNQFEFFGLKKPARLLLQRPHLKQVSGSSREELQAIVDGLWAQPEREFQYLALELLVQSSNRKTQAVLPELSFVEGLIKRKSWWDTVDLLASRVIGPIVLSDRERFSQEMDRWIKDENMWIRRTALLHQLMYRKATDSERLFSYIRSTMHEEEFFIRKAIGWALREFAKTDAERVRAFLDRNKKSLSTLSYREASKHL